MHTSHLPAVALESTVISHGLPYPHNLELAQEMEAIVRSYGAEPRTVAILGGQLVAGLSPAQLRHFATAHRFGIHLFATGGIGGVHRGTGQDISADLQELAQTPVIVVCAGAKAILDLPGTLEYLETAGVTVVGYGTEEFPAFYSRTSGLKVDVRCDTPEEVVAIWHAKQQLGLPGGMLVTVPVPVEDEIPALEIAPAIEQAVAEAEKRGLRSAEVTPFLLSRLAELTGERSLRTNLALLKNNARVAAQIAVALRHTLPDELTIREPIS